jgi:pyruvate:ferredoxin (flavodoxin) oxidoreductase, homodimeric
MLIKGGTKMARKRKSMDGNTAAAHVSYAFTEVAGIYPITPSSNMAEMTDAWSAAGQKNIFGREVKVIEMQSEAGAAGTVHGSLATGALTTTYTASQGLLLMIPNMYKIAGELLPGVIHCSARTVAAHALSIFGDHGDIYACRQTGFAMLASSNPQEVMDLGAVAHMAAIKGRVPFLHFFDGFRTSHEIQKIEEWDYADLNEMVDHDAINAFRKNALNPERPVLRGTAENPDIFFQAREACNVYYDALPGIVEEYMDKVNKKIGTDYSLFNYYGAPDADRVIIAMGSAIDTIEEVVDYKIAAGEKVGVVKVRLYRPFVAEKLKAAIPATVKSIAVLDRTKEPGALGEPLYLDVVTALRQLGWEGTIVGGRYALASKDTTPACIFAVYNNLAEKEPKNGFTVGIEDDVTFLSLPIPADVPDTTAAGTIACKFWGLGGDGTVGANKNSIKIIGDHTEKYIQAYFQYDSKKTSGVTVSHLRFGDKPIRSTYYVSKADFVACHEPSYVLKGFSMVRDVKPGGIFLLNCQWSEEEIDEHMPAVAKRYVVENNIKFYYIDAITLAKDLGMGPRTNTILQAAFFALSNIIPIEEATTYMKDAAKKSYSKKGDAIVEMNYNAIDAGLTAFKEFTVPASWATAEDKAKAEKVYEGDAEAIDFYKKIVEPSSLNKGDDLPVSAFKGVEDGTFPLGTAAYEKRGVGVDIPEWIPENCIQCNQCALVCPHATIRPFALSEEEVKNAPADMKMKQMVGKGVEDMQFAMVVSPLDCMGCTNCVDVCPAKEKALVMKPQETQLEEQKYFDYAVRKVTVKETPFAETTVKGSQFNQPLLEFSGACAGCVETAYAKLITQLFGERMYIANATGCSSIWGGSAPAIPYTKNYVSGHGPAWANSLFEDNAEFGLGMFLGQKAIRDRLIDTIKGLAERTSKPAKKAACEEYLATVNDGTANRVATEKLIEVMEADTECPTCIALLKEKEYLAKKSQWIFGGDGWAYDIGFGGLDHVIASGEDVNIMVFDTEVYSNTGGQASKASQLGQVAQFAAAGKNMRKKDLAAIAMSYGNVYVAQIAMGKDYNQTIKAMVEAESYNGPSIIIGYAPCIAHGVKGGMTRSQAQIKKAVDAGYWNMFRFDPRKTVEGKNPFTLDSKAPTADYIEFIEQENRYAQLKTTFPEKAEELFAQASKNATDKYNYLTRLNDLYAPKED